MSTKVKDLQLCNDDNEPVVLLTLCDCEDHGHVMFSTETGCCGYSPANVDKIIAKLRELQVAALENIRAHEEDHH